MMFNIDCGYFSTQYSTVLPITESLRKQIGNFDENGKLNKSCFSR